MKLSPGGKVERERERESALAKYAISPSAERGESIGDLLSGETPTGDLFCGFDMGEKPS